MAYVVDLTSAAIVASDPALKAGDYALTIDGTKVTVTVTAAQVSAGITTLTFGTYGTLTLTGAGTLTFKAASSFAPTEEVTFTTQVTDVNVTAADFTAAANAVTVASSAKLTNITGSAFADSLTGTAAAATLNGGAGNDVVNLGTFAATGVSLGTGADTVNGAASVASSILDYNYAEGDKLVFSDSMDSAALGTDGLFIAKMSGASIQSAKADSVFKVAVTDSKASSEYWTVGDATAVTLDASANKVATVIDATEATSASIASGTKDDTIALGTKTAATITASKTTGKDKVTHFSKDDVLDLGSVSLSDLKFTDANNVEMYTGSKPNAEVDGVLTASQGIIKMKVDGAAKTVAYATAATQSLAAATTTDFYVGDAKSKNTTLDASALTTGTNAWDLSDTTKYRDIAAIAGDSLGGGYYVGTRSTVASSIDLSKDSVNGGSAVYGGTGDDTITLSNKKAAGDTIVFGTADGEDTVANFNGSFKTVGDVVNLYDVQDLVADLKYAQGATEADVVLNTSGSKISLNGAVASNVATLKLMNAAGTTKKVAVSTKAGSGVKVSASGADDVIGEDTGDNTLVLSETEAATSIIDLTNSGAGTQQFKNFKTVDATGAYKDSTVYITGVQTVGTANTITTGGKTAYVHGNDLGTDTITGSDTTADTFMFAVTGTSTHQNNDTVTKFDAAKDTLWFYDQATLKDLANVYKVTGANTSLSFTGNAYNTLGVTAETNIVATGAAFNVETADGVTSQVKVSSSAMAYDTKTKLYASTAANGSLTVSNTTGETSTIYLGNGTDSWGTVGDTYYKNISSVTANGSGTTKLLGSAGQNDILAAAGSGTVYMWGGGSASDTMTGSTTSTDIVMFGKGDGIDTVSTLDKADTIMLYDATSIDAVTMTADTNGLGGYTLTLSNDAKLKLDADMIDAYNGGLTFQVGSGDTAKNYTYSTKTNSFTLKA